MFSVLCFSAITAFRSLSRELYRQTRGTSGHAAESRKPFEQRDVCYVDDTFVFCSSAVVLALPLIDVYHYCTTVC